MCSEGRESDTTRIISTIICTRNRADFLRNTLNSLARVHVPSEWTVECIIVDNGSTDHTQEIIAQSDLSSFSVRVVEEHRPGKSHALNTALHHAQGEVLLFTDDDVRMPTNWITGMTAPILSEQADAVAGGVHLAPHLQRPWQDQNPWLTTPLATTDVLDPDSPQRLVGANMAISSRIFETVPGFDPDLGPGSKLGLGEETLLTKQMRHHGFRITSAFDLSVEHHCSEDRLSRQSYLKTARKIGRSQAHVHYHWDQVAVHPFQLLAELGLQCGKLAAGRLLRYSDIRRVEGLAKWEMVLLTRVYHRRQLLRERGTPRKYQPAQDRNVDATLLDPSQNSTVSTATERVTSS